jgi:hypothetical protein
LRPCGLHLFDLLVVRSKVAQKRLKVLKPLHKKLQSIFDKERHSNKDRLSPEPYCLNKNREATQSELSTLPLCDIACQPTQDLTLDLGELSLEGRDVEAFEVPIDWTSFTASLVVVPE